MELAVTDQLFESIRKANKILVALPYQVNADLASSGTALALYLQKLNKEVSLASDANLPASLEFLPKPNSIINKLEGGKDLVVVVDTAKHKLDELSYRTYENSIDIFLKAKEGSFSPEDISFSSSKIPYDLIITLGCQSLESLGGLFKNHAEILYETAKINIDYHPGNEYFGAINLVDIAAVSVSEILTRLLVKFENEIIDSDIATCLLSGVIVSTHSFQHSKTTPNSLLASADLINLGARQQEIIKHVFKTKTLPLLQLWGRALARIKTFPDNSLIYSVLNAADFAKSNAEEKHLPQVLLEMLDNVSSYNIVSLVAELPNGQAKVYLAVHPPVNFENLLSKFKVQGSAPVTIRGLYQMSVLNYENFATAEKELQEAIKT